MKKSITECRVEDYYIKLKIADLFNVVPVCFGCGLAVHDLNNDRTVLEGLAGVYFKCPNCNEEEAAEGN